MTLEEKIRANFDEAAKVISANSTPPGVLRSESDPDTRFVAVNANFNAIAESLLLLAKELDGLKSSGEVGAQS